jgi:hypothetical protein
LPKNHEELIPIYKDQDDLNTGETEKILIERVFNRTPTNYDDVK